MPISITPYIPDFITVHLGPPSQNAENVTVSFPDYIKNVASSEIYPTWNENALRANILAQISYALNRVYTEYYPSRGYPFQITASTSVDQKFIRGRNIFENIDQLVDEIFNSYLRRQGNAEPLAAKFCNGTTVTCDGLSQWGSEALAQEGYESMQIIHRYYGDDVERVDNAPIQSIRSSYPGYPLSVGSSGEAVEVVQTSLNRVSQDYPAIPKIWPVDGVFGPATQSAVRRFQEIFNLTADGVVGKATWYRLVSLYVGVKHLSELVSEGQQFFGFNFQYPDALKEGDTGEKVLIIQYVLAVLAQFNDAIPFVELDGVYGPRTKAAVTAFQQQRGIAQTGTVDRVTWDFLFREFQGVDQTVLERLELFPSELTGGGSGDEAFATSTRMTQFPGYDLSLGSRDMDEEVATT